MPAADEFSVKGPPHPVIPIQGRGERLGFDDARGELFFEVLRVLHQRQPKAFLLENAPGISM